MSNLKLLLGLLRTSPAAHALIVIAIAAFSAGATVIVKDDGSGRTVTVRVAPLVAQQAPAGDLQTAAAQVPAASELRDETPPGVPSAALVRGAELTDSLGVNLPSTPQPVGGAQNYSVTKDFSGHVYSDFRAGIKPTEALLHYTVSPNVSGWSDVRGVQRYFKDTRVGSATDIMDFEGHILQMVPFDKKAWTQGAFNPFVRYSVELIATGRESRAQWLAAPIFTKRILASRLHDVMVRYGIPRRWVDPRDCSAPLGYSDHNHLECGNDHTDVAPAFPFDVLARQLRAIDALDRAPVSAADKVACRKLNWWRASGRPGGRHVFLAVQRKRQLTAHRVTCEPGKAAHR